jgi:hypothetical protein
MDEPRTTFGRTLVKRHFVSYAALIAVACACPASAQVAGQLGRAVPIAVDSRVFGGYVGLAKHQAMALGQLRLSFYPGVDFGFQGGFHRYDGDGASRTAVELGADLRTLVVRRGASAPLDVALGGAVQLSNSDSRSVLSVAPTFAAGRSYELSSGAVLSPYFGFALMYARSEVGGNDTTDLSLPLRMGLEYQPRADFRLVLELQEPFSDPQGTHPKLVLGANFPF